MTLVTFTEGSNAEKYGVPELGTDYEGDFAILVLKYLYDKWYIETPIELKKPVTMPSDNDAEYPQSYMRFRQGFPDDAKPFQVLTLQGDTHDVMKESTGKGSYSGYTDVWVTLIARSLGRDGVDNESDQFTNLGIMERNVERIANQQTYQNGITGIQDLIWVGGGRIYTVKDSWANSLWGSKWKIMCKWFKVNAAG